MQKFRANYRVLDYKLVMGIPKNIPNWILKRTMNYSKPRKIYKRRA